MFYDVVLPIILIIITVIAAILEVSLALLPFVGLFFLIRFILKKNNNDDNNF